ncbi:hypothetical protein [Shewanella waksmanii]|uniref:hypothetical protein n=1 Tax=Shewanella waksmanii TaxID=213783 RepID=UPI0037363B45
MSAVSGHIVNEARPSVSIGITPTITNEQGGASTTQPAISKVSVEVTLSQAGKALSEQASSEPKDVKPLETKPSEELVKNNCECKSAQSEDKQTVEKEAVDKDAEAEADDSYGIGKYIKAAAGIGSIIALFA